MPDAADETDGASDFKMSIFIPPGRHLAGKRGSDVGNLQNSCSSPRYQGGGVFLSVIQPPPLDHALTTL